MKLPAASGEKRKAGSGAIGIKYQTKTKSMTTDLEVERC
jgi:hypothetical protein